MKSKAQHQPERSSRRLRNLVAEAGPSSRPEESNDEKPRLETAGHRSDSQARKTSQRIKQQLPSEPAKVADPGRQHAMAGTSGQADQVGFTMFCMNEKM